MTKKTVFTVEYRIINVADDGWWIIEHPGTRHENQIGAFPTRIAAKREEVQKLLILKMKGKELR